MSGRSCPSCGWRADVDAHFCTQCGTPLDESAATQRFTAMEDPSTTRRDRRRRAGRPGWHRLALVAGAVGLTALLGYWLMRSGRTEEPPAPEPPRVAKRELPPPPPDLGALLQRAQDGDAAAAAQADAAARQALASDAADSRALRALGLLSALQGDLAAATAWLDSAVAADAVTPGRLSTSESDDLLNDAAVVHAAFGNRERAELLLGRILARTPGHAPALANRGLLALAEGKPDAAEADFRAALAASPSLCAARCGLASALLARGAREAEARTELAAAVTCPCAAPLANALSPG